MNRLKHIGYIFTALLLTALLSGCGQSTPQEEPYTRLMNFPGLEWGMTPDEVRAAQPLEELTTFEESLDSGDHFVLAGEMDLFGVEGVYAVFHFYDNNGDGTFSLSDADVRLPASTDVAAVREAMVQYYGTPAKDSPLEMTWESEVLRQDVMPEEEAAYIRTLDEYSQRVLTDPITTVCLTTRAYVAYTFPDGEASKKSVSFLSNYAFYVYESASAN